jgi:aspartate aminotransferase
MKLSFRVRGLVPSATLGLKAETDRLRREGVDVVDFGAGEPDFDTPFAIREAAKRALDGGDTHYGGSAGKPTLRAAIARRITERYGGNWQKEEVLCGVGGKGVLFLLMQALIDPGDEVLIFCPYWVSFPEQVRLAGGTARLLPARQESGFIPDPGDAARALTPRTRGLILNSPNNPSGAVVPLPVLERFADLARERGIWIVSDETYDRFVYPGFEFASASALRERSGDRIALVGAFSKTYAMTGWRIGYTLAPRPVIEALTGIQSHDASHPTSFVQTAAEAALAAGDSSVEQMLAEYTRRRELILAGLSTVPGVSCLPPGGAFYVFAAVGDLCRRVSAASSADLAARLLREARIAVVPGEAFGVDGYLRFSYALPEGLITEGLRRLRTFAER